MQNLIELGGPDVLATDARYERLCGRLTGAHTPEVPFGTISGTERGRELIDHVCPVCAPFRLRLTLSLYCENLQEGHTTPKRESLLRKLRPRKVRFFSNPAENIDDGFVRKSFVRNKAANPAFFANLFPKTGGKGFAGINVTTMYYP